MRVTPIYIVAEAIVEDDETPQGEYVEKGEKKTQSGFLGTHKKSPGDTQRLRPTINVVDFFGS